MNRDEILEFAKDVWGRDKLGEGRDNHFDFYVDLVIAAMAKEREACALVCEEIERNKWAVLTGGGGMVGIGPMDCAAAIRARGEG